MQKLVPTHILFGAIIGLFLLGLIPVTPAQEPATRQPPSQQTNISDKELRAFAKAYVEFHKIRLAYEPSLKNVHDPEKRQMIQQEANSKIEKALEKQGLNPTAYNRIFTAVNADEKLRKKTLKLIDEERSRS
ncbi:MAG: DUF4168 domain-containing protein [Candidatus Binatia bacterium]